MDVWGQDKASDDSLVYREELSIHAREAKRLKSKLLETLVGPYS